MRCTIIFRESYTKATSIWIYVHDIMTSNMMTNWGGMVDSDKFNVNKEKHVEPIEQELIVDSN